MSAPAAAMTPTLAAPWRARILALGPSVEFVSWIDGLPPETTYTAAWIACPRGDWMLWLIARCEPIRSSAAWSDARRPLVLASVDCARLALPAFEARYPGDDRPRRCLDTTAAWVASEATQKGVERAQSGAWAAYIGVYSADAAASAAAAWAADAAYASSAAAAYVAADAAAADAAAADAAYVDAAAWAAAAAAIVRARFPAPPELPDDAGGAS